MESFINATTFRTFKFSVAKKMCDLRLSFDLRKGPPQSYFALSLHEAFAAPSESAANSLRTPFAHEQTHFSRIRT